MTIDTEVLIVGAGPSGATLALLLAKQYGIRCTVISRHKGTANTPRAHIFNQRAMEVMRDLGIEDELKKIASSASDMAHTSWLHSLTGKEYGRMWSWGNDPSRKGQYEAASPCQMSDLPQSDLEPVLVEHGRSHGVTYHFYTEFVSQQQEHDHVATVVRSRTNGVESVIRSAYLVGADGARSSFLDSLGIKVNGRQLNTAFNVHIRADMSEYFAHRPGSLNWILNPDAPDWSAVGNFRMVRPWNEFVVSMHPAARDGKPFEPSDDDIRNRLYQMIGERKVPIEILSAYRWTINDQVAESWTKGRVVCIGDATHRHPPINGLGSNTCVSDAFNLAWKLAEVLHGTAQEILLQTVTTERKPVGEGIVRRANAGMEVHRNLWSIIGLSAEERQKAVSIMESATPEGIKLRNTFCAELENVDDEVQAVGIQMNQIYLNSSAVYAEPGDQPPPMVDVNLLKEVVISTFPGFHLPHVWLAKDGQSQRVSILDLAGHGHWTLFTGIGGQVWQDVASNISKQRRIELHSYSIGPGCNFMDAYRQWSKVRQVTEDGVILVRPDHFVAWRSNGIASGHSEQLCRALDYCLGFRQ